MTGTFLRRVLGRGELLRGTCRGQGHLSEGSGGDRRTLHGVTAGGGHGHGSSGNPGGHWDTLLEVSAPMDRPSVRTWRAPTPCLSGVGDAVRCPPPASCHPSLVRSLLCHPRHRLPALRPAQHHGRSLLRLPGHPGRLGGDRLRRARGLRRLRQGGTRSSPFPAGGATGPLAPVPPGRTGTSPPGCGCRCRSCR